MNILLAPDKFKGSLTSFEVCKAIEAGIHKADKNFKVFQFPMADGGDGFADVMQYYLHTASVKCQAQNPLGKKIESSFQWDQINKTAIIELASSSGLVLLNADERNPLKTSTFGTGLLIKEALRKGAEKIILGIGGSATNDAGTGILEALGFGFSDSTGNKLKANGENLLQIKKIIPPDQLPKTKFVIASDVQNVLYGPGGAAFVYAAQKGASQKEVKFLDDGLINFSSIITHVAGKNLSAIPGTGAAGGIAAGMMAFFDVTITSGLDIVLDASRIKTKLNETNLIITGEGRIDTQSLQGKVVGRIASLARQYGKEVIAFCGSLETTTNEFNKLNLNHVESLISENISEENAMTNVNSLLTEKVRNYFSSTN